MNSQQNVYSHFLTEQQLTGGDPKLVNIPIISHWPKHARNRKLPNLPEMHKTYYLVRPKFCWITKIQLQ